MRVSSFYFSDLGKYPGVYQMSLGNLPLHERYDLLENADHNQVMFADSVGLSGNQYENALLFFLPIPFENKAIATCLVCVQAAQLDRIAEPVLASGGSCLFFDSSEHLAYTAGNVTQEAVADLQEAKLPSSGEMNMKTLKLDGRDYVVTYISSGKTGWRYVALMPLATILLSVNHIQREMVMLLMVTLVLSSVAVVSAMRLNYAPCTAPVLPGQDAWIVLGCKSQRF